MKKIFLVGVAAISGLTFYSSCTKDKTTQPPACTQTDTVNTYTNSVKAVLDFECASGGCHDAGSASSGIQLDDYSHSVAAARDNSRFFCVIDFTCTPHMPQGYASPMDTAKINALKRWRDNCYPQ